MTRRLLFLCAGWMALAGAALGAPAADILRDPSWQALFVRLAPVKNRQVPFTEGRYFPFRRTPVVLSGVVRLIPGRGLSLEYEAPESRIVIIDAQGVLVRDLSGQRAAPADRRMRAATSALAAVMRFNAAELARAFTVTGERTGDAWTLTLQPRDPSLAGSLNSIVVSGEQTHLARIDIHATARIEILLGPAAEGVTFSAATLTRCFR